MKINLKLLLVLFITTMSVVVINAQTVSGTVLDSDGFPVPNAEVKVNGSDATTTTDLEGNFSLGVPAGVGVIEITTPNGVETLNYNAGAGETVSLGEVNLEPTLNEIVIVGKGVIDIEEDRKTPVAVSTVFKEEIRDKAQGNVEFPEVLKNTPSVYVSNQTGFGDSQMFTRGFNQSNTAFLLNGQPINGMEDGKMYWSNWSGMTEIANAVQIQRGLGSSKLAISSVGGTINIITKATEKRKGGYVGGVVGNDSYLKLGLGYNTGINEKGWGLSFAFSHWQAHRKWADGTFGSGDNYFLSFGKVINSHHAINFLVTGAPQQHGQRWSQSLETIERDSKFNQHWGYTKDYDAARNGYTRGIESERTNFYHKPVLNLNWDWSINGKSNLATVLYGSFGRGGGTGPLGNGRQRTDDGQIDYYGIEQNNALVGVGGDYNAPNGAGYIRRSSMNNHQWFGLVSNYNNQISDAFSFNIGLDGRMYKGDHFRQVADFYGLQGWLDRGNVITSSFKVNPWSTLFKFADENERIAYDNTEWINYIGGFTQMEYAVDKFSVFVQGSVSTQSYEREDRRSLDTSGNPENSGKESKVGYNVKGGLSYNISEKSSLFGNAGHYSRQPYLDNVFLSTTVFNPDANNEKITGFELGYRFQTNTLRYNVNLYHTTWNNRTIRAFVQDTDDNYIIERGIGQTNMGFEFDMNFRATNKFELNSYFTYGDWTLNKIGSTSLYDGNNNLISTSAGEDLDDVHTVEAPQTSFGLGFKYKFTRKFYWDANLNWYGLLYKRDVNFDEDQIIQRYNAGTLPTYALVDTGVTYFLAVGKQDLKFRANVYNLFNTPYLSQSDAFGYINGNGRTYNIGVTANF